MPSIRSGSKSRSQHTQTSSKQHKHFNLKAKKPTRLNHFDRSSQEKKVEAITSVDSAVMKMLVRATSVVAEMPSSALHGASTILTAAMLATLST